MDRKMKYYLFISAVLWPLLVAAVAATCNWLPSADPRLPFSKPHDSSHNWVGQGVGAAYSHALLVLVLIYSVKFLIGRLPVRWLRVYYLALIVVASLPYIWLLIVLDWRNMHVCKISCWVYDPFGIWFVPAVSFTADTVAMRSPRLLWYVCRSCLEFLLIVPWMYAWTYFSFFGLGGGWI